MYRLFGEIALLEKEKKGRSLSAMTNTDSILLWINQEAFDLIKEKIKREKEDKGKFVYNCFPGLKENTTLYFVQHNAFILFE